jgi:hypothetical protein
VCVCVCVCSAARPYYSRTHASVNIPSMSRLTHTHSSKTHIHSAFPAARDLAAAEHARVESIIAPLGLQNRRAANLIAMSSAYSAGNWRHPEELPGCGKYAAEAYHLFVAGTWRETVIMDRVLRMYLDFLHENDAGVDAKRPAHTDACHAATAAKPTSIRACDLTKRMLASGDDGNSPQRGGGDDDGGRISRAAMQKHDRDSPDQYAGVSSLKCEGEALENQDSTQVAEQKMKRRKRTQP